MWDPLPQCEDLCPEFEELRYGGGLAEGQTGLECLLFLHLIPSVRNDELAE